MKNVILIIFSVTLLVYSSAQSEEQTASSRDFLVRADVPTAEVSPSFRLRVRLVFVDLASKKEFQVFTGASDRWAITWASENVLLLFATKNEDGVPVHAFQVQTGRVTEREASEAEQNIARHAYERKYKK